MKHLHTLRLVAVVLAFNAVSTFAHDRFGSSDASGGITRVDDRERDRDRDRDDRRRRDRHEDPPDWLIGRFHGYNGFYKAELSMWVSPNGRLETRSGDSGQRGRYIGRGTIEFEDGKRFEVDRTRRGVRLVESGNRRNVSDLARDR